MPKLLQIDSCLGILSTGRITEGIAAIAHKQGWECHIAHGARYVGKSNMISHQIGSKLTEYLHYAESLLLDKHGLASKRATRKLIQIIENEIKPDIIHLHCVHGYYLNYKILFDYLNTTKIPVVWTFHDCWAFTGHCAHFAPINCSKWQQGCYDCDLKKDYPSSLLDNSTKNYQLKKELFLQNQNLQIVVVSNWLESIVKQSFFKGNKISVINNGIDLTRFKPYPKETKEKIILGVASAWSKDKGLYDFYKLRELLPIDTYIIKLVGLTEDQIRDLPEGIVGISRTSSIEELARIYSNAFVFVNTSYADSFPTVNIESIACGTPVITYKTGGSPEIIDEKTGYVVACGDIIGVVKAIEKLNIDNLSVEDCRNRALSFFDKDDKFSEYVHLYDEIMYERNNG